MFLYTVTVILIWLYSINSDEKATRNIVPTLPTVEVALVEYQPLSNSKLSPDELLDGNALKLVNILSELSKKYDISIIIFPESALDLGRGKKLKPYACQIDLFEIPCIEINKYPKFFQRLSCAARMFSTVIVFNLIQIDDSTYTSTDVVLNTDGAILTRLKKDDRIGQNDLHNSPIPFEIPVQNVFKLAMLSNRGIVEMTFNPTSFVCGFRFSYEKVINLSEYRNYLISSNWISQLPFLTSLQVYQMWAQEYNLTVLFSGINDPTCAKGGTGVYHATGGPILMDIIGEGRTKAYVYSFPTNNSPGTILTPKVEHDIDILSKNMDNFKLLEDPNIPNYESVVLNTSQSQINKTLCHVKKDKFCCQFSIVLTRQKPNNKKKHYTYHLVAYKGPQTYFKIFEPGGIEVCGVIACLDSKLTSCGKRFSKYEDVDWSLTFENITIKANFGLPHKEKIYYSSQFPNSLLSSIRPISPFLTNWTKRIVHDSSKNTSFLERTFSLKKPQNRILTFAIFGRNFTLNGALSNSGAICGIGIFMWSILVVLLN